MVKRHLSQLHRKIKMMYGCYECGCVSKDIPEESCSCECHKEFQNKKQDVD